MITCAGVGASVRDRIALSHQRFWDRLAAPGNWWTGAERIAIAAEARAAQHCPYCRVRKAALSPHGMSGTHATATDLPSAAVDVIHAVLNDANRLTRRCYTARLAKGLSDGQYVEIVGTVVALISIDRCSRGIGTNEAALPRPLPGTPNRYRPASAGRDEASVPMVPADNTGLWPANATGNVIRAMSLVPDEVRTLNDLGATHYLPHERVRDPSASQGSLTRPQMELIASKVSVLNDCFYRTSAHAWLLGASSELAGAHADVTALTDVERDSGVTHGDVLAAFAQAIVNGEETLAQARDAVTAAVGPAAMVDAAGVASNFKRMVRIADATGIELDDRLELFSAAARTALGLRRPEGR